jgi:predicted PurR-regulated permease PerM
MDTAKRMSPRAAHAGSGRAGRLSVEGTMLSRVTRLIVSVAGVLILFYFAKSVVLPVLLALVGSMALKPPVAWLRRHHVPAPLGAGIILCLLAALLAFGLVHFGRPVAEWVKSAPATLPRLKEKYQHMFGPVARLTSALYGVDAKAPKTEPSEGVLSGADGTQIAGTVFTWTGSLLAGVVETGVLLFLLLASGDRFVLKLARVLQTLEHEANAVETCRQIQQNISTYLFSVSLINLVFGTVVGLSLSLTGLPNAAMWGAIAMLANFIPYFGPIAGVIVVAGAGLLAFDTVGRGLLPAGAYLLCHVLEADLITPLLLGRRFRMNAFVIFVMLMFCGWLWGVLGALLAMPLLVTLNVICSRVPACSTFADFLSA